MRQRIAVEMDDGNEFEVQADGRDIRSLEAATGESFMTTQLTYTQVTQLAAHAAIREGKWGGTAPEFVEANISVQIRQTEPLDPTQRAVTEPSSSPSPSVPVSPSRPGTKQDRKR